MKSKLKCTLFFIVIMATGILSAFVFFDLPVELRIYPASLMAVLIATKLITDAVTFNFNKKELEKNGKTEELFKLEQEIRDCNPYILAVLLIWLGIMGVRHFHLLPPMIVVRFIEKFAMAIMMILAILVTFSFVGTKVFKNGRLPGMKALTKHNNINNLNK